MERPIHAFDGFEPLTGNYVYCPNQFFDVCLPHCSRGAVRIIAYVLRQTLGWLDEEGNPKQQEIRISHCDLILKAGVSKGSIGPALAEAVATGFIRCEQVGLKKSRNERGQSAIYSLRWDTSGNYSRDPNQFAGFFAGAGNRTPVPNQFFDEIVCNESLAVIKVVGTIIRQTIGYQNQFGGRRSSHPLSFTNIQRLANIKDRKTLSQALRQALDKGFIECVDKGRFTSDKKQRRPSTYRIRWLQQAKSSDNGSKTPPAEDQFNKPTRNGSESLPSDRFKKTTNNEMTVTNDNRKTNEVVVATDVIQRLTSEGMDAATAKRLVEDRGVEVVTNQLDWLDARNPRDNRVGMLRKAIQENWTMPSSVQTRQRQELRRKRDVENDAERKREDERISITKRQRAERRAKLQQHWDSATIVQREAWIRDAVKAEASKTIADLIRRQNPSDRTPQLQVLEAIARERNLPTVCAFTDESDAT